MPPLDRGFFRAIEESLVCAASQTSLDLLADPQVFALEDPVLNQLVVELPMRSCLLVTRLFGNDQIVFPVDFAEAGGIGRSPTDESRLRHEDRVREEHVGGRCDVAEIPERFVFDRFGETATTNDCPKVWTSAFGEALVTLELGPTVFL